MGERMRLKPGTGAVILLLALPVASGSGDAPAPASWPEPQRAFVEDGAGLLLGEEQRAELAALDEAGRGGFIEAFLADPLPDTPQNELVEGIDRRQRLVRSEFLGLLDARARVLFLHGAPAERLEIECGQTFVPLEIWRYGEGGPAPPLVLYKPAPDSPYRLWLPVESKRALYSSEMQYWLEQWEELRGLIRAKRFDLQTCPDTPRVDEATGIDGLRGYRRQRPTNQQLIDVLKPPADLAAWAQRAAATPLPEAPLDLEVADVEVLFPDWQRQRIVTRILVTLPENVALEPAAELEKPELQVGVDGLLENRGREFERFRLRFKLPPDAGGPLALAIERPLRPHERFVARLRLRDEVGGAEAYVNLAFQVPAEPRPVEEPEVPEQVIVALGEELKLKRVAGRDSLLLVPPETDVVVGLWRAEALVTGESIQKVVFLVDDQPQLTRNSPPFSAELRLSNFPVEQLVRVEGYDADGELVAADEIIINQARGALAIRIVEPRRGRGVSGTVEARAEITVPEERRVESVEFVLNEQLVASLSKPPWQARVEVPAGGEIAYLTAVVTLDDGSRAEDVRFLNTPDYFDEVEVNLKELYTTVTDRSGRLVKDLTVEEFEVFEDGRRQNISKFELVRDLPLTIGIAIDTSGSMVSSLPEAQQAAVDFLRSIMKQSDRAFVLGFSDQPYLLMPPTDDVSALEGSLSGLRSLGYTTLHDAIVTALYYFRGVRGQRALILLSDGDDTASGVPFRDAMEYARRSGVAVYSVGLDVDRLEVGIRRKLTQLAEESGGRAFFISRAEELAGVYSEVEEELRSQYLLAYTSDRPDSDGAFRQVEVKVRGGKLKARTTRGYYP